MSDDTDKNKKTDDDDTRVVSAAAEQKQRRHRVDEYIAMVIALGVVFILWFLQAIGLY